VTGPAIVAGTIGPDMADVAVANLDSISRTLDSLQTGSPIAPTVSAQISDDFSPAPENGTEVELFFHGAHDPFGSHWEEEEVVIDRYASLEDAALRSRRVTSDEGRAIGAAVTAANGEAGLSKNPFVSTAEGYTDDAGPAEIAAIAEFDPAGDPLLPEESPDVERPRRAAISLDGIAQDDRDLIVVDDEQRGQSTQLLARPRRADYRQLFTRLRNG
jgi:hypothetical protein